jgi:hypothetical protein
MGEDEAPIDRVFHQLHRPACARLETLKLNVVRISATTTDLSDIVEPVETANQTIQVLELCHTMNYINFASCDISDEALNCLEQTLLQDGPNKISILSMGLRDVLHSLLRSLPHMPRITNVYVVVDLDTEEKNLLLHAVKEKKTLLSFTTRRSPDDVVHSPTEIEIGFISNSIALVARFWIIPMCVLVYGHSFWAEWRAIRKTWMLCFSLFASIFQTTAEDNSSHLPLHQHDQRTSNSKEIRWQSDPANSPAWSSRCFVLLE